MPVSGEETLAWRIFLGVVHDSARKRKGLGSSSLLLIGIYPGESKVNHLIRKKCMTLLEPRFSFKIKGYDAAEQKGEVRNDSSDDSSGKRRISGGMSVGLSRYMRPAAA
jgi:hypothetical protein